MAGQDRGLDDAARAAWLSYVAGNTQDEIAAKLGVSRQKAQRLISQAQSAGLIRVRIDHPISNCLSLAQDLTDRFGLRFCNVVPSDPASGSSVLGVADATADAIEQWLNREKPVVLALGTGRTLKAAVQQLPQIDCPQHRIVSLTGNIAPSGATAFYNVLFSLGERVTATTFPLPMPVVANSASECAALREQPMIRRALDLVIEADVAFVGLGQMTEDAPLFVDGFITSEDLEQNRRHGAVGEIVGWVFDADGRVLTEGSNARVAAAPLNFAKEALVIGTAMGASKVPGLRAAIKGGLLNGLITDEVTGRMLLK
jgi:DNA-binding transcriptional regulator LsrR (DeoR family)